jgi:hypothetical protein
MYFFFSTLSSQHRVPTQPATTTQYLLSLRYRMSSTMTAGRMRGSTARMRAVRPRGSLERGCGRRRSVASAAWGRIGR